MHIIIYFSTFWFTHCTSAGSIPHLLNGVGFGTSMAVLSILRFRYFGSVPSGTSGSVLFGYCCCSVLSVLSVPYLLWRANVVESAYCGVCWPKKLLFQSDEPWTAQLPSKCCKTEGSGVIELLHCRNKYIQSANAMYCRNLTHFVLRFTNL
jgi:hypothetical protein